MDRNRRRRRPGNLDSGNTWKAFSPKINQEVKYPSSPEYKHWLLVEADPDIIRFDPHPGLCEIVTEEGILRTKPDMLVYFADGRCEMREVKESKTLRKAPPQVLRQLHALKTWSEANGVGHRVISSDFLKEKDVLIHNWQFGTGLLIQPQTPMKALQCSLLAEAIRSRGKCRLIDVWADPKLGDTDTKLRSVFELARIGCIHTNLDLQPLGRETLLWS